MFAKRYLSYVLLCALAINSFEVGIELFYGPNRQETKVNHKKVKSMGGWQCLFFLIVDGLAFCFVSTIIFGCFPNILLSRSLELPRFLEHVAKVCN